jgi:hypothetical protein
MQLLLVINAGLYLKHSLNLHGMTLLEEAFRL